MEEQEFYWEETGFRVIIERSWDVDKEEEVNKVIKRFKDEGLAHGYLKLIETWIEYKARPDYEDGWLDDGNWVQIDLGEYNRVELYQDREIIKHEGKRSIRKD